MTQSCLADALSSVSKTVAYVGKSVGTSFSTISIIVSSAVMGKSMKVFTIKYVKTVYQ